MRSKAALLAALALGALLFGVFGVFGGSSFDAVAQPKEKDRLGKHDHQLLAEAKAKGEATVTILVASEKGQNNAVERGLVGLGATVRYKENDLDYIRAIIPTGKVVAASQLKGVLAVDLDEIFQVPDPRPEGSVATVAQPAPGAATPRANPYMPIQDTGAAAFLAAHPTWDGRGVTIGIVDTGVSFDHPSLVTTSTGAMKIVDWVTGTDPLTDPDPTWINMTAQVSGASFSFCTTLPMAGCTMGTYTAPAAGSYRIGLLFEGNTRLGTNAALAHEYAIACAGPGRADLNRDGVCNQYFAVLWKTSTNQVWVDTDIDLSFADESAMTDYKVNNDVGYLGTDNLITPIAERVPFVVQTDGKNKFVNIGIVSSNHGSHVAGIAAGHSLFGGAMSGAAPGAKIVSSRACLFVTGCTSHALFEGMIYVAKQSNVDVINMSIGGLPALNDGNNARCFLYDNLIETYKVQMYLSIGNSGPGLNTAGDPGLCGKVMGVGAYITDSTYEKNYGTPMPHAQNIHFFSSRGPTESGAFKPNFVAPGAAISSTPLWQAGGPVPGTYALPPGYSMFNGTSMAAPQAAGVGALLVSAAQQFGAQHQPDQIRQALMSSADYISDPRFQAYDQGTGLLDVVGAWDLLKTNIKTVSIMSEAPVDTLLDGFLATPGMGQGIYDREDAPGVGGSELYAIKFTRTDGPGGSITYNLSWMGNDGTFSIVPGTLSLPKNVQVMLNVTATPATTGAHSAILRLDDPATTGIDYQVMNTIIVPEIFSGPSYAVTKAGTIDRGQTVHHFFRVPTGTTALKVDMVAGGGAGLGAIRFLRWHPFGLGIDSNATSNCYNSIPGPIGGCSSGSPTSRTTTNPAVGVWEVTVDAHRRSDDYNPPGDLVAGAPYSITATIFMATVTPNPDAFIGGVGPHVRTYTGNNLFAGFTGNLVGTALGSARIGSAALGTAFSINHLEVQPYPVVVPAATTSLRATIGSPSDPGADLDLFVFNCTAAGANPITLAGCTLAGFNADGDSEESVTIGAPAAGMWSVVVDGFDVPALTTTYNYIDLLTNAAFGTIAVADVVAVHATGTSWGAVGNGTVTVASLPALGRVLYGNVRVEMTGPVVIGQSEVIVTPP